MDRRAKENAPITTPTTIAFVVDASKTNLAAEKPTVPETINDIILVFNGFSLTVAVQKSMPKQYWG